MRINCSGRAGAKLCSTQCTTTACVHLIRPTMAALMRGRSAPAPSSSPWHGHRDGEIPMQQLGLGHERSSLPIIPSGRVADSEHLPQDLRKELENARADQQLTHGTKLFWEGFGEGEYDHMNARVCFANDHFVRFPGDKLHRLQVLQMKGAAMSIEGERIWIRSRPASACTRFCGFVLHLALQLIVYPACGIAFVGIAFPADTYNRSSSDTSVMWIIWAAALATVSLYWWVQYSHGQRDALVYAMCDGIPVAVQGSIAYGLVLSHQLENGQPRIAPVIYLLNSTLGYTMMGDGEMDHCVAESEIFYPAGVFLFIGLLRSWERAAFPHARNKLQEEANLLMHGYRWLQIHLAKKDGTGWRKTAWESVEAILREIDESAQQLDFVSKIKKHSATAASTTSIKDEQWSDRMRLRELELSFVENCHFEPFLDRSNENRAFEERFKSIASVKIKAAVDSLQQQEQEGLTGSERGVPGGGARESTAQMLLSVSQMTGARVDNYDNDVQDAKKDLAKHCLAQQPVVYAMLSLRIGSQGIGMRRWDTQGTDYPVDTLKDAVPPPASTFIRAADIVRMIVLRSKADHILLHRWSWWVVVVTSFLHAAGPVLRQLVVKAGPGECPIDFSKTSFSESQEMLLGGAALVAASVAALLSSQSLNAAKLMIAVAVACSSCAVVGLSGFGNQHALAFFVNYWLTFSLTIRLAKCFGDTYERYRRMRYFLQLCPWATMKAQHFLPTDGLLPTFELTSITNIVRSLCLCLCLCLTLSLSLSQ